MNCQWRSLAPHSSFQFRPPPGFFKMAPLKSILLLLLIILMGPLLAIGQSPHFHGPLGRPFPHEPPRSWKNNFPPAQTPNPPSIRPQPDESEKTSRMLELAKAFVRRYLTPSDLRHLQERIMRAKEASAGKERIRHVVWHFLADALSPEQKVELGAEKRKLWMEFANI